MSPRARFTDAEYARRLGITVKKLRDLGGQQKLRALDPSVVAVLTRPHNYGGSKSLVKGGLKARGMPYAKCGGAAQRGF